MKNNIILFGVIICSVFIFSDSAFSEDLPFPTSTDDIVNALSFKQKAVTYQGQEFVTNENGEVFMVIDGRRFRMRGIKNMPREGGILPRVGALITFDNNSDKIKKNSHDLLDRFGQVISSKLTDAKFLIEGHTDNVGASDYNLQLSQKRSESVKHYLVSNYNIAPERLLVIGAGESSPITPNETAKGRALNRRVEFIRMID